MQRGTRNERQRQEQTLQRKENEVNPAREEGHHESKECREYGNSTEIGEAIPGEKARVGAGGLVLFSRGQVGPPRAFL